MFKKAFTMVELVVALLLVAILAAVTIGITRNKMAKVDKYSYYIAYSTMQDVAANIISQSDYDIDEDSLASVSIYDNKYIAKNISAYQYVLNSIDWDNLSGIDDPTVNITQCVKAGYACVSGRACCSGACDYSTNPPHCPGAGNNVNPDVFCVAITGCQEYNDNCSCKTCKSGYKRNEWLKCDRDCSNTPSCGANQYKSPITCECLCNSGYERASDGTCVLVCSADQYRDDATKECKNCSDITTWAEYRTHMPPCPPDCERFGMIYDENNGTCVIKYTAEGLCKRIKAEYNISGSACDITAATMSAGVANGFSAQTPHIKMSNGINIYIASDLVTLAELSDAADKRDRIAYIVYVDVNGEKKGKGVLYQDVFPFYLTISGKVIPAYDSSTESGGSSPEHLSLNIIYDSYTESGTRVVKAEKTNLDFVTAACETGYIRSAKYCGAKVPLDICSDPEKDCRFIVNKPMKFFR